MTVPEIRLGMVVIVSAIASLIAGCRPGDVPSASPVAITTTTERTESRVAEAQQTAKRVGAPIRTNAKAVLDETEFDFGQMETMTSGTHIFQVRNVGSAPLTLTMLETSCKCTIGEVDGKPVPPGGSTQVKMEWNTGNKVTHYSQWAQISTNDPENTTLTLKIRGTVRQDIRFEPEEIVFGDISPSAQSTAEVLVFSDRLQDFELLGAKLSAAGFQATVEPANAERLAPFKALKGYVVRITSPDDLPKGAFSHYLQLSVQRAPGDKEPLGYELPVQGSMQGRLLVAGNIDHAGNVLFGTLGYGKGMKTRLTVKVRDPDSDLKLSNIQVEPSFLKVELKPSKTAKLPGMYDLFIEVPKETEPCGFRGDAMAKVQLKFDHPRIRDLNLLVDFSVRPPAEIR